MIKSSLVLYRTVVFFQLTLIGEVVQFLCLQQIKDTLSFKPGWKMRLTRDVS